MCHNSMVNEKACTQDAGVDILVFENFWFDFSVVSSNREVTNLHIANLVVY